MTEREDFCCETYEIHRELVQIVEKTMPDVS